MPYTNLQVLLVFVIKNVDFLFILAEPVQWFSSICYLFGRRLNAELGVPIGLIDSTWGGTIIEAWSSPDALAQCNTNTDGEKDPSQDGENDPSQLYNAMVYPYTKMAIKGALWYQGINKSNNSSQIHIHTVFHKISN